MRDMCASVSVCGRCVCTVLHVWLHVRAMPCLCVYVCCMCVRAVCYACVCTCYAMSVCVGVCLHMYVHVCCVCTTLDPMGTRQCTSSPHGRPGRHAGPHPHPASQVTSERLSEHQAEVGQGRSWTWAALVQRRAVVLARQDPRDSVL